jgi:putative transposase
MVDCLQDIRTFRLLNVVDDFKSRRTWFEVDFSLPTERVILSIDRIIERSGTPLAIRVDIGPEYISGKY